MTFAQRSSVLAAEAPALATRKDTAALSDQANRLSGLLAEQNKRLAVLRGMTDSPEVLAKIDAKNTALAEKMNNLRGVAESRIALAAKLDEKVASALTAYQDFTNFLQPLVDTAQNTANVLLVGLKRTNSPSAVDTIQRRLGDVAIPALRALMEVQADGNLTIGMLSAASSVKSDAAADVQQRYTTAHSRLMDALKAYDRIIGVYGDGPDRAKLNALSERLFLAGTGQDSVFALRAEQEKLDANTVALLQTMTAAAAELGVEVEKLVSGQQEAVAGAVAHSKGVTDQSLTISVVLSGVALLISVAIGWLYVGRVVIRRLSALASSMERLAQGDRNAQVKNEGHDEITKMAGAVQVFKSNMLRGDELAAEAARLGKEQETIRQKADADRAEAAARQAAVVDSLAKGLAHLAKGDLTYRLSTPFSVEYEGLRSDFNAAVTELRDVMKQIIVGTQELQSGTDEISTAADDLSRRTEQQAASVEETAATLNEITARVRKSAEGAIHARDIVGTAKTDAEHSSDVMRQTIEAMTDVEKSSSQIGQIISVINEIAFQTNLLALNAGVEAARAGDSGRGFAVVASEVRALAQRSAEAAREIKDLVIAATQQVDKGVHLVGESGVALKRILGQVVEINDIVTDIAALANEQAAGLDQVNLAVTNIETVTQQNATMVEETTASSHNLARDTEALAQLVGRFEVDAAAPSGRVRKMAA
ncbi:HAMP domain-containing methyl-accepting chemotaxis protein [Lichenifustis flavocetrariae]|uniref:HAMP domain-containing methyl-accepting chemotaxis protein n=1 Tax=Lichenifustis flavocetrariae TaxID=2949735 RepID=A0AA41YQD9_9HYPH|nr:HAMP domain-containing methyl-accepting chemotaxis protein [Lichenifustis flavocetrariae]MCW6506644.1 HAMP domain-containing methyl-accepting chemotaxis protein [Lichenifustis flavocetrariae]